MTNTEAVKPTTLRIPPIIKKLAQHNIIAFAIKTNSKAETFTDYIKRLIIEDNQKIKNQLKGEDSTKEEIKNILNKKELNKNEIN